MEKNKTTLIRLSERDNSLLAIKSTILGLDKSKLMRDGAFTYWNGRGINAEDMLSRWQNGDANIKSAVVDLLFEYFRRQGYPHNKLSQQKLIKEMTKISNSPSPLLEDDHLQTTTVGLSLPNNFHRHMVKVHCMKKQLSPWDLYNDDVLFKDAINRWMELGKKPSHTGLRRILRTRNGVRSVVNFKPVIARYIYDTYAPANGIVLDPCAGFGGRLSGLISTNKNLLYHGIDPCGDTASGNMKMASFFSKQHTLYGMKWKFKFRFDLGCAEEVMTELNDNSYDLVFTSPPYFDTEKYEENNPNQSYIKFPNYEKWKNGFLAVVIQESARILKPGCHLIWNVKNYKKMNIGDDSIYFAQLYGLKLIKTYKMRLMNSEYNRKKVDGACTYHSEPIFVFQK